MDFITAASRYILPVVTIMLLSKCIMTLLLGHPKEKVYGFIIDMKTGEKFALNMWETSIGRSNTNDIVLTYNTISRAHAVISRRIDGWYVYDLDSKSGIKVNGVDCEVKTTIKDNDIISLSGIPFRFEIADDPVQRVGKKSSNQAKQGTPERDAPYMNEYYQPSPSQQTGANGRYQPSGSQYAPPENQYAPPEARQGFTQGGFISEPPPIHNASGHTDYVLHTPPKGAPRQEFYDEHNTPNLKLNKTPPPSYYAPISEDIYSQQGNYTVETPSAPMKERAFFQPRLINKDTGEIFILCGNEVSIGTGLKSDIRLKSREVARLHALLVLYEDGWAIESTSPVPTFLNSHRISSPQLLFDGDIIAMGDERLYYKTNR